MQYSVHIATIHLSSRSECLQHWLLCDPVAWFQRRAVAHNLVRGKGIICNNVRGCDHERSILLNLALNLQINIARSNDCYQLLQFWACCCSTLPGERSRDGIVPSELHCKRAERERAKYLYILHWRRWERHVWTTLHWFLPCNCLIEYISILIYLLRIFLRAIPQ